MIRVLFIMGNMGLGGAETQIMKIYRAIDRDRIQFDFCVNVLEKNYYEDEILELGGYVFRTPPKTKSPIKYLKYLYSLIYEKYTVVVKCTEHAAAWNEMLVAKIAKAKIRAVRSTNTHVSEKKADIVLHYLSRLILNRVVNIRLAPSKEAAMWLFGKRYEKNTVILNNGIPIDSYRFCYKVRDVYRQKLGLGNSIVIGTVGRMSKQKNQSFLLDVFAKVYQVNKNAKLVIVGEGELRRELETKIEQQFLSDAVMLLGKRNDVPSLLMAMDIFCLPSLYEGMPNCVIEAEATGLPCIVSDTITKDANLTGHVNYVPLELDSWCEAIKLISEVKYDRNECAGIVSKSGYDIQEIAKRILAYLEESVNKCN